MLENLIAPIPPDLSAWLMAGVILLPLLSFVLILAAGRRLPQAGAGIALSLMAGAFGLSIYLVLQTWDATLIHTRAEWLRLPGMVLTIGLRADALAALLCALVTGISLLVHIYSLAYMRGEADMNRYWAALGLFCAAMLGVVLADNLLLIFAGWELMGLSSWLLIGFYRHKDAAARAAQKAFLFNRAGDMAFLLGIALLLARYGTLDLAALAELYHTSPPEGFYLTLTGLLIFGGALGKSAQFPLQVWLPDAMEGPTPVSSLIHAATMVAAGVYLLARTYVFLSPDARTVISLIGAITAMLAAFSALAQQDIKRVLAYSTISQLGYMVMAIGAGAPQMALFHLFTHAFFKCALFLSAGAVIHQLHHAGLKGADAQDLRNMGGLRKKMPFTFALYLIPMLALSGVPFTSGFLSKEGILLGIWQMAETQGGIYGVVLILAFVTAGITALYMARHAYLIFGGKTDKWENSSLHDPGLLMQVPLAILALGSLWLMFSLNPMDGEGSWIFSKMPEYEHLTSHAPVAWVSLPLVFGGLLLGYLRYGRGRAGIAVPHWIRRLSEEQLYISTGYERLVALPGLALSRALAWWDTYIVDGLVNGIGQSVTQVLAPLAVFTDRRGIDGLVNGLAGLFAWGGRRIRRVQSGHIQRYLLWALAGIFAWIIWLR